MVRVTANAVTEYLDNVIVVPRKAVSLDGGKDYVECLVNGNVQKRFVNAGLSSTAGVWVLQGLNAGETFILD